MTISDIPSLDQDDRSAPAEVRRPTHLRRLVAEPLALFALVVLALMTSAGLAATLLAPGDPLGVVGRPLLWPGVDPAFPLGTDSLGRDVFAGLVHGARVSLLVGVAATAIGTTVGVTIGALAGYFGGLVDAALLRLIEIFQTVPNFILLVVVVTIAGPSVATITLAIGLVGWTTVARLVRAEFRSIREREYVLAARAAGYTDTRIIFRHILPNAVSPIVLTASIMVASAILQESALTFMGLGDPAAVSWGTMIGEGRQYLRSAWYLSALPGVCIVATVLALNLLGDAVADVLDPRRPDDV